jgi:hypothetical protein
MDMELTYHDFILICDIGNPQNFAWGLRADESGIWVQTPPDRLGIATKEDILAIRPPFGFHKPIITFPCSHKILISFLKYAGMEEYIEELDKHVLRVTAEKESFEALSREKPSETEQPSVSTGGRPKGPLYEAVEFAYKKFRNEGNTEILRPGKVIEFLDRLKDLAGGENRNVSDYITERIEIVKKRNGSFTITTQERVIKEVKCRVTTEKKSTYTTADVSKLLTALRKKFPLPA